MAILQASTPLLCNETESHETLEESMWSTKIFYRKTSLQHRHSKKTVKHLEQSFGMRGVLGRIELQLLVTYKRNAQDNSPNTTQIQHSTALQEQAQLNTANLLFYFPWVKSTSKPPNTAFFVFQERQVSFTGILTQRSPTIAAFHSNCSFWPFPSSYLHGVIGKK